MSELKKTNDREFYYLDKINDKTKQVIMDSKDKIQSNSQELIVKVVANHSGKLVNLRVYPGNLVARGYANINKIPYKIPVLKHHDSESDPVGHIISGQFEKLVEGDAWKNDFLNPAGTGKPGSGIGSLDLSITDYKTIEAIVDERFSAVSTGARPGGYKCSVCGSLLDWWGCPNNHIPGFFYKEDQDGGWEITKTKGKNAKLCYLIVVDKWELKEVSFVNIPAMDLTSVLSMHYKNENKDSLYSDLDCTDMEISSLAALDSNRADFISKTEFYIKDADTIYNISNDKAIDKFSKDTTTSIFIPVELTDKIKDLPDSAFAYIELPYLLGQTKDKQCRHFPHHNASGDYGLKVSNKTLDYSRFNTIEDDVKLIEPITDSITKEALHEEILKHLRRHKTKGTNMNEQSILNTLRLAALDAGILKEEIQQLVTNPDELDKADASDFIYFSEDNLLPINNEYALAASSIFINEITLDDVKKEAFIEFLNDKEKINTFKDKEVKLFLRKIADLEKALKKYIKETKEAEAKATDTVEDIAGSSTIDDTLILSTDDATSTVSTDGETNSTEATDTLLTKDDIISIIKASLEPIIDDKLKEFKEEYNNSETTVASKAVTDNSVVTTKEVDLRNLEKDSEQTKTNANDKKENVKIFDNINSF